jgi:hypothetical protein
MPPLIPPPGVVNLLPEFSETSSYVTDQQTRHNGQLFVALGPVAPGPFNPADWTEISPSGSVTVVTQDSPSVVITGDGSAGDPLTAAIDPDSLVAWGDNTLIYVDTTTGNDAAPGTLAEPKLTIASSMLSAGVGDVVMIAPGTYNESVTFKTGVMLKGFATIDSAAVVINGQHTMPNGVSGCKCEDLKLHNPNAGQPALLIAAAGGGLNCRNVTISNADGKEGVVVRFTGNCTGFYHFSGGSIVGEVEAIDALQLSHLDVIIDEGSEATRLHLNVANSLVSIGKMFHIGRITHQKGTIFATDFGYIEKDLLGNSIVSTCDAGQGALFVLGGATMQPDGSYGALSKPNSCPFVFLSFKYDPLGAVPAGTNLYGENARNIHGQYTPVNYALLAGADNLSVYNHLKSIDAALPRSNEGQTLEVELAVGKTVSLAAGEPLMIYKVAKALKLPIHLTGSQFFADAAGGFTANFEIRRNATVLGTVAFAGATPTVIFNAAVDLLPGDMFSIVSTTTIAFSDLGMTLLGLRILDYVP